MIHFKNFWLPINVVAAAIAAVVTGSPELASLWFAVWELR